MRKHLFFGRGHCVHKQHIQHSLHSGKGIRLTHGLIGRDTIKPIEGSGGKKKISPLKFKF